MLPEVEDRGGELVAALAVLRRAGLVVTRKEGSTVYYSLTSPQVAELLKVARTILTTVPDRQVELLEDLREGEPGPAGAAHPAAPRRHG